MEWAFGMNGRTAALRALGERSDATVLGISVFSREAVVLMLVKILMQQNNEHSSQLWPLPEPRPALRRGARLGVRLRLAVNVSLT